MTTDPAGQARILSPSPIGGKVTLQISPADTGRWAFLDPLNGEVTVANDFANIVLVDPRDRDALQQRALWGHVDSQIVGGRYRPGGNIRDDLARMFATSPAAVEVAFRRFLASPGSSTSDQAAAQRLDRIFQQLEGLAETQREIVAGQQQLLTGQRELAAKLDELSKRPGLPGDQEQKIQTLEREVQRFQAEYEKSKGQAENQARLQRQYEALERRYQALLESLNNGSRGATTGTPSSGISAGSRLKALGVLALAGGGIAGAIVLLKELTPKADATFTISPDCEPPCAFLRSTTVVNVRVTTPDTANFDYKWDFGDGRTGSGTSDTHTYSNDGTFTIALTASSKQGDPQFGGIGASASRAVTVKSLTGLWRFTSGNAQGSYQLTQNGTSLSGQFTVGSAGNISGTLTNPRTVRISVGFSGDTLDGTVDANVGVISGNFRVASTGAIAAFTLTRVP
jgi:hypothetical protein